MKTIFVGSLSYSVTEDSLRDLFGQYGAIERVRIVTDRDTGRSRGFGFVDFADDADAERAIAILDRSEFKGRALTVKEAIPRPQRKRKFHRAGGDTGAAFAGGLERWQTS